MKISNVVSWCIPVILIIVSIFMFLTPLSPKTKGALTHKERKVFVKNRKDTIAEFGNSRFVVLRAYDRNKKENYWLLYDNLKGIIEPKVYEFKELGSEVYILGKSGYTKLNYETEEFFQSKEILDFSRKDKRILEALTPKV